MPYIFITFPKKTGRLKIDVGLHSRDIDNKRKVITILLQTQIKLSGNVTYMFNIIPKAWVV
jgi:hypothetical protein